MSNVQSHAQSKMQHFLLRLCGSFLRSGCECKCGWPKNAIFARCLPARQSTLAAWCANRHNCMHAILVHIAHGHIPQEQEPPQPLQPNKARVLPRPSGELAPTLINRNAPPYRLRQEGLYLYHFVAVDTVVEGPKLSQPS